MNARTHFPNNRATMEGIALFREGIDCAQGSGGKSFKPLARLGNQSTPEGMEGMATINADPPHICVFAGQGVGGLKVLSTWGPDLSPPSPPSPPDWLFVVIFQGLGFSAFQNLSSPVFLLSPPSPPRLFKRKQRIGVSKGKTTKSCKSRSKQVTA